MFGELFKEMLTLIGGLIVIYFVYIIITKKNDKSTTNTASMAQMALKELVERVVEEAKMLPGLRSSKAEKEKENSTFEDLLATAILNKVIEKFQSDYVDGNRNILSEISPNRKKNSEIETSFEKGQEQLSLTIEERIEEVEEENDVDFSSTRRVPFPEFGMDIVSQDSSDENHEQSIHDHITPLESWEENWLFQKRKMQIRSDPVSMLVPYPSEDYRALIGDKNVEDISSDDEIEHELKFVISSATESSPSDNEEEEEAIEKFSSTFAFENGIEKLSPIFGGAKFFENGIEKKDNFDLKNGDDFECKKEDNFGSKKENDFECKNGDNDEFKAGGNFECEKEDKFVCKKKENLKCEKGGNFKFVKENNVESKKENFECEKREENLKSKQKEMFLNGKNETEEMFAEDQVQQESEYTEHFDTATQKHMDSLTKIYGPMGIDEVDHESSSKIPEISSSSSKTLGKCRDSAAFIKGENLENEIEDEVELATPPRPGTIAEREHRKWENARPIKNNPYSKKNIQKRLLERQYNCYSIITESNISKPSDKPVQIVLGAKNVDFKRFARDYYINDAITSNEEKQKDLETNQHSKIEDDIIDYESNSLVNGEGQLKVSNCQKNNEEAAAAATRSTGETIIPSQSWKNSDVEKLLEKERRNNKNEINARFNNKDSKNTTRDINFETKASSQQRVINKLDLKSFGYECGLRRTQSIQFDSRNHSQAEQKPKIFNEKNEFNSSEIDNDDFRYPMSGIFSAKSVPNIADIDFSDDEEQNGREIFVNSVEDLTSEKGSIPILPSVRKLAKAFSKSTEINSSMLKMEKKRSTTPEILLVEKPRQLELNSSENERNEAENNKSSIGDISIISPGKLKNNIQFWEQLQKQS